MAVTSDQVYGDSEWLRSQPGFAAKFSNLLVNSGIIPDAATLQKYGLADLFDPATSAAAANNPYSTAALLKNHLSGSLSANGTRAAGHNALFSGAFQNMQDQAGRDYQQSYSQAGAQGLSSLLGIQGDRESLYNSIFQRKLNEPVAADPTVYAPAVAPAPAFAPVAGPQGLGIPVPQGPYVRTGPEAGWATTPVKKKTGFASRAL